MALTSSQDHAGPSPGIAGMRHVGAPAAELAACLHAVGLLVSECPDAPGGYGRTTFELLGRRVEKVLGELAAVHPGAEWSRPSSGRALASVPTEEAASLWRGLVQAGRMHGLANVGEEAAGRYRLLESSAR